MSRLDDIVELLRTFDGITRKFVLPSIIDKVRHGSFGGDTPHSMGEDSAAISTDSDDVVLLTTDAIVEDLCLNHSRAAGFNVILANVMDIYAAGGTPTSFAVAVSYSDPLIGEAMMEGLVDGSRTFRIPIVRGHTNPKSSSTYIVGSATGTVHKENLLTAGGAETGDSLIMLFDTVGKRGTSYSLGWDSVTGRSSEDVALRLSVMNDIAKTHLVNASKDVSVAGVIGTAVMMLEYSGKGGVLSIDALDLSRPESIPLEDWLRMFISLGFLLSVPSEAVSKITDLAEKHSLTAVPIGAVTDTQTVVLRLGEESRLLFDFSEGPVLTPKN
ncbi:MAG: AIR synthase related protein [Candidatus Thorarchaeota archaeon]